MKYKKTKVKKWALDVWDVNKHCKYISRYTFDEKHILFDYLIKHEKEYGEISTFYKYKIHIIKEKVILEDN